MDQELLTELKVLARNLNAACAIVARVFAAQIDAPPELPPPGEPNTCDELDVKAAAKSLGVSTATVDRLASRGEIEKLKIGRRKLFSRQSIEAYKSRRRKEKG